VDVGVEVLVGVTVAVTVGVGVCGDVGVGVPAQVQVVDVEHWILRQSMVPVLTVTQWPVAH